MRCLMLMLVLLLATPSMAADDAALFSSGAIDIDGSRISGLTHYGWDGAWRIGDDYNKLVVRSRGEGASMLETHSAQLLYSRYISHFWDLQFGVRYDHKPHARWRGVVALEGLAPFGVESLMSFYVGDHEQLAGEVEFAWPLQLTQKLVAEPYLNGEWSVRRNLQEQRGAGVGVIEPGLILRCEFNRHVALYVDLYAAVHVGTTRSLLRSTGERVGQRGVRAGVRLFNW